MLPPRHASGGPCRTRLRCYEAPGWLQRLHDEEKFPQVNGKFEQYILNNNKNILFIKGFSLNKPTNNLLMISILFKTD